MEAVGRSPVEWSGDKEGWEGGTVASFPLEAADWGSRGPEKRALRVSEASGIDLATSP